MDNRISIKECSKLLNISEQTLRILIQKGTFKDAATAVKIKNRYFYIIYKNKMKEYNFL